MEARLTAEELFVLSGGRPPAALVPPRAEHDEAAGRASLTARGAMGPDGTLHLSLEPLAGVLSAPGLLARVDVETAGLRRRSVLLATPRLAVAARLLEGGAAAITAFRTADFLRVLCAVTALEDRPEHGGRVVTSRARIASALGQLDRGVPWPEDSLVRQGQAGPAGAAFLLAVSRRRRAVDLVVHYAASASAILGCELAWVDGGKHGLWLAPPFADGELDDESFEVAAVMRSAILTELAAGLPVPRRAS